jgi:alpha/beta superfamily hydrolase
MDEKVVTFRSGELLLEGLIALPAGGAARAAIVCHPHPHYGGSMHNNVVEAVLEAMWQKRIATLRFNFRGVGGSEGTFDGGSGEAADAVAAIEYLGSQAGANRAEMIAAGYSFGALVGLRAGLEMELVSDLIAIAPPIAMTELDFLAGSSKRIALIAGDRDDYCPARKLRTIHERIGDQARLRIIEGTDHFFGGFEEELTDAIGEML